MHLDLGELERKIEKRLEDLEHEQNRLQEDLKVIQRAVVIATDIDGESKTWRSSGFGGNRKEGESYP